MEHGVQGLPDKSRPYRLRRHDYGKVALDVLNTLGRNPPDSTSPQIVKIMAEQPAISEDIIGLIPLRKLIPPQMRG
ncbi:MAG: hypothetical protein LBQ79_12695 [Deltaproteobacteria bacterium]|jgi:hypothetical protein|nr:hypothetical protein [Deltaproteobacteria bacterium]